MMRQPRFHLLLLLCISFVSVNPGDQTPPKAGTATVAGRVTLHGEPARGVHVVLQLAYSSSPSDRDQAPRTKTDQEGRFRFTGVNAGQYVVSALAPGFVASRSGHSYLPGKTLNLSDGETIEEIELTLKRGGAITGRVTDAQGNPIIGNTVRLHRLDENGRAGPAPNISFNFDMYQTDDRGIYRLYGLPAGKYKISVGWAQQEGSLSFQNTRTVYPRTFHPDTPDEAQAKVIELDEGGEVTDVDIKIGEAKQTYKAAGRVVDAETGRPLAGIEVSYGTHTQPGRLGPWIPSGARTNLDGEFQIHNLLPGRYAVFIGGRDAGSDLYSEQVPFQISEQDVAGLEIKAQRGASISGSAVIEGTNDPAVLSKLTQVTLNFQTQSTPGIYRSARVMAQGAFRVAGLSAGKVMVNIFQRQLGLTLLRIEHNGAPVNNGIEVRAGEQVGNVRVVLGHGNGVVRGQVKLIGGSLPEGLQLSITARSKGAMRNPASAQADARGYFIVKDLMPGEYELRVHPFGQPMADATRLYSLLSRATQTVTVSNGVETQTTIVIDLTPKENER